MGSVAGNHESAATNATQAMRATPRDDAHRRRGARRANTTKNAMVAAIAAIARSAASAAKWAPCSIARISRIGAATIGKLPSQPAVRCPQRRPASVTAASKVGTSNSLSASISPAEATRPRA